MAKTLTPEAEAALRKVYKLDPSDDVQIFSQLIGDDKVSAAVSKAALTPLVPAASPSDLAKYKLTPLTGPPPAPVQKTREAVQLERGIKAPVVVQPESGAVQRGTLRTGTTGQEFIHRAQQTQKATLQEAANAPTSISISPDAYKKLVDRTEDLATEPRTATGERRTLTPTPETVEELFKPYIGEIAATVIGGLAPQTIVTPQQAADIKQRTKDAYNQAKEYIRNNPDMFPPLSPTEDAERFKSVVNGFLYQGHAPSAVSELVSKIFTSTLPSGQVIESPITTAGKLLNVGEAAIVTGAKTGLQLATGKELTPTKTMGEELKSGMGLMGAGSESGAAIGKHFGWSQDTQDYLSDIGGLAGFAASMAVPIDLGVGSIVGSGIKGAKGSAEVSKAFGATRAQQGIAGIVGGGIGSVEGALDAYRIFTPPTGGSKAISKEIENSTQRFLESPKLKQTSAATLDLAANPKIQDAIDLDRAMGEASSEASPYDPSILEKVIRDEFDAGKAQGKYKDFSSFDDYKNTAENYGIDFTNTAGGRAADANIPPANVRSKELEDASRKTGTGVLTTNHFDDIATGGRSDLYYQAWVDTLDDNVKLDLVNGKQINNAELMASFDKYMNEQVRPLLELRGEYTPAKVKEFADAFIKTLEDKGIRVGTRPLGASAEKALNKGNLILPPTRASQRSLDRAFRVDTTRKLLNNFSSETGKVGVQAKLGAITLGNKEAEEVKKAIKVKYPELEDIKVQYEKQRKLINLNDPKRTGFMNVTDSHLASIKKHFIDPFVSGAEGYADAFTVKTVGGYTPYNVINVFNRATKTHMISPDQFNTLVRAAIAIESSTKVTAKTAEDLSSIASSLVSKGRNAEFANFTREVFKPKDFSESGLGALWADNVKRFQTPVNKSSVVTDIVKEVNSRMGALSDTFKTSMRKEEAALSGIPNIERKPTAFANTLVKEYTEQPVYRPVIIHEGSVRPLENIERPPVREAAKEVRAGQPRTISEIERAGSSGAYEMFRTNLAAMFGGYEKTIDSVSTTSRTIELDKSAITVSEMRNLMSVLIETEPISGLFRSFQEAIKEGDNVRAINILQRTHIDLYGYSIEQILTRKGGVPSNEVDTALSRATRQAKLRVGNEGLGFFDHSTGSGRSIAQSYAAASQQGIIIKPSDFKDMLMGNHFVKAQANIVDDVLSKASTEHPLLFPSAATLQDIAQKDFQVTKAAILRGLEERLSELSQTGIIDFEAIRHIREDVIPNILSITEPSGVHVAGDGGYEGWVAGTSEYTNYMQDLLIAALQDQVNRMSISGASHTYLDTFLEPLRSRIATRLQVDDLRHAAVTREVTRYRNIIQPILDNLSISPGSMYSHTYGSTIRSDATVLFYQTSLQNVRNQLKNPFAGSLQGVADRVLAIPLLTKEVAGAKRPIFNAVNLKSITETMEGISLMTTSNKLDQVVAKDGEKLAKDIIAAEAAAETILKGELDPSVIALGELKQDVIAAKESAGVKDSPYTRRLIAEYMVNAYDNLGKGKLATLAKNGMLGGIGLPNLVYLMGNMLTGPLIVASTVGLGKGFKSIFDLDAVSVLKDLYRPSSSSFPGIDKIIVTAPDGTIHTQNMFIDYVKNGILGPSQASAELSNNLIRSAINWAGDTGLMGDSSAASKFIQRNFVNVYDMNVWSSLANATDQYFRLSVFKQALQQGEQLPQASKLAREALFDYGNLTSFEKNAVSKVFWFWTFRRNNWRSMYTALLTDPRRLKIAFAQQRGWQYAYDLAEKTFGQKKEDTDYRYIMKDYSENRMYLNLTEDPENQRRYATYGPSIPHLQAVGDLVDYLSIPLGYLAAKQPGSKEVSSVPKSFSELAGLVTEQSNPFVQGLSAAALGVDLRTGRDLGTYLDPRLMWYIRKNDAAGLGFDTYVSTEPVPFEEEKPGVGYYQGRQWRITKTDDQSKKNWAIIKSLLLMVGVQRTMNDYAPLFQQISPVGAEQPEVTLDTGSNYINAMRALGIITVQDAPMIEEIQRANRQAAGREIREVQVTDLSPSERRE